MSANSLIEQTRARFPDFSPGEILVTALEKGGSDRKFYRIDTGLDRSLILVKYGDQREENRHYVEVAEFLAEHGLNVPKIFHHEAAEGLIWMQDLGEVDLWAFRNRDWETRKAYYQTTLDQAALLHALDPADTDEIKLQPGFDERLYQWEQNYFVENCLGRHFSVSFDAGTVPAMAGICQRLADEPRVLVHRDFQSQNIMISDQEAWLIDFQGMRPGLRQYDLASLLYDPYVSLTEKERAELLAYYQSKANRREPGFMEIFDLCALQRLMQALGAYGFLGHEKGKSSFLKHIPKAIASLREVVARIEGLSELGRILETLES